MRKLLENNGFTVNKTKDGYELQQYTPAGEDWWIFIQKLKDIKEYAENFDPEEEFKIWFEAGQNGVAGVPGVAELWKDQLWKQETLSLIADQI